MKTITSVLMLFLLGAMFATLFALSSGMNMADGMTHCPFMAHEEVLCTMHLGEHIEAWKSTFLATTTTIVTLLGAASAVAWFATLPPNLLRRLRRISEQISIYIRERTYTFSYRPLQELFASGILHPKVF